MMHEVTMVSLIINNKDSSFPLPSNISSQHLGVSKISTFEGFVDSLSNTEIACQKLGNENKPSASAELFTLFWGLHRKFSWETKTTLHKKLDPSTYIFLS